MKIIKINNGITLVALVITVIVLLILATAGIGAIVGEDGLITKAQQAAELYEQASRNEANAINEIFNMVNGGNQGGSEEPTQPVIDATNTNVQFIYTPSTPTKGSVTVEITTTTGYMIQYRKGETGNYSCYTGAFTVEENTAIYAKLANSSGVTGGYITGNVANIDKIAPVITVASPSTTWGKTNSVTITATDSGSTGTVLKNIGIIGYGINQSNTTEPTYTTCEATTELNVTIDNITENGTYYAWVKDQAGNTANKQFVIDKIDRTAPQLTIECDSPRGDLITAKVTVTNKAESDGDITYKYYVKLASKLDSEYDLQYTGTLTEYSLEVSDGPMLDYNVKVEAIDASGNIGTVIDTITSFCFLAGTKVLTEDGYKNIEDIIVGEKVYSINTDTNVKELSTVTNVIHSITNEVYEITVGNEVIKATPRHKFYIVDKGLIEACDLQVGDRVNSAYDENLFITKIEYKFYDELLKTYNLTVDGNHNYLITEYEILVHNSPSG